MQINNLKIKYNKTYDKWQVITPNKVVLEEFDIQGLAKLFALQTKDFLKRKKQNG